MSEDERGITPADVTAITVERAGDLWQVTIEQGNGDLIKQIELTSAERLQLGWILDTDPPGTPEPPPWHVSFEDSERGEQRGAARTLARQRPWSASPPPA